MFLRMWSNWHSSCCKQKWKMTQPSWKSVWHFLKSQHTPTIWLNIPTPWNLSKRNETRVHRFLLFVVALFMIIPNGKQPKCLSTGECIFKNHVTIYTPYSCKGKLATKRNKILIHAYMMECQKHQVKGKKALHMVWVQLLETYLS